MPHLSIPIDDHHTLTIDAQMFLLGNRREYDLMSRITCQPIRWWRVTDTKSEVLCSALLRFPLALQSVSVCVMHSFYVSHLNLFYLLVVSSCFMKRRNTLTVTSEVCRRYALLLCSGLRLNHFQSPCQLALLCLVAVVWAMNVEAVGLSHTLMVWKASLKGQIYSL